MSSMFRTLASLCTLVLVIGIVAPLTIAFFKWEVAVATATWNYLQIGGFVGMIVFWFLFKSARSD